MSKHENLFSLAGQHVMVVGGTGGIGGEIALACGQFGAKVSIAGRDADRSAATADQLDLDAEAVVGVALDVTSAASVAVGLARAEEALGPVTVMVNSAGTQIEEPATEVKEESWDAVMDANFKGAFLLSQAAARSMIAQGRGGSIIHVTSVRSNLGIRRGYAAYVGSKGGLGILIKQLASEWAEHGIRVNGLCMGATDTPMLRAVSVPAAEAGMRPADVGQAVVNVLAHGAGGPTGQSWLFGASGTPRARSLEEIAALAPA